MSDIVRYPEHMVFGLDIGTRSIVGSVGYMEKNQFKIIAHYVKEHDTRAMLDGQIHDIQKVGETIDHVKKELELQIGRPLKDVCIAAAGRVLKTVTVDVKIERNDDSTINSEDIYSLDLLGIEKAYEEIRKDNSEYNFYCVGYSVVKYFMNDYIINNLEGHKARTIGAQILATFLPNEVVDGLYSAVEIAGLQVANLTLEPIAAINVAIPEQYRLLNIALVDVGAGTSDISITKDGSIIGYGMIPHAGDEITESIIHKCLVDFKTGEKIKLSSLKKKSISFKDIMGLKQTISPEEVQNIYSDIVNTMTKEIADKIIQLNGGKSVNAVFVVGGGGKVAGFTKSLAGFLNIPEERVALRGEEVLGDVTFVNQKIKKDPLLVTPVGICVNFYNQKNNFIFVYLNEERVKLYDNNKLTVTDAAIQSGMSNINLFPKRGRSLRFTLNKDQKIIRGIPGEPAQITINNKEASISSPINKNDRITIIESTMGEDGRSTIDQLAEYKSSLTFNVNDKKIQCPRIAFINDELVLGSYLIKENDKVSIPDFYTLFQLLDFMDIESWNKTILVNGHEAKDDEPIYENFQIQIIEEQQHKDIENVHTEEILDTPKSSSETDLDSISITVNGSNVVLYNRPFFTFVDIFDFYPFDTTKVGGENLITKINGQTCGFSDPLNNGDIVDLYWT